MPNDYLLSGQTAELERLRLQSLVWEPDARALFEAIPIERGWRCIDVGCGAVGVLRPLSQLTGPTGSVLGVDVDPMLLEHAAAFVAENALANVTVRKADLFAGELPEGAFDLVHLRFMFAPIGREEELLARAVALCRPGGVVVVEEPNAGSWSLVPPLDAFDRLKELILTAFAAGGGDFNAGRRTFAMLRDAGLHDVQLRAAVHALPPRHPYLRVALQFATSLRGRIPDHEELDRLTLEVEEAIASGAVAGTTFMVTQAWGRV